MKRLTAECLDFEEVVGRSDAVYKSTRGTTTAQKFKRQALCIGLIRQQDTKSHKAIKKILTAIH